MNVTFLMYDGAEVPRRSPVVLDTPPSKWSYYLLPGPDGETTSYGVMDITHSVQLGETFVRLMPVGIPPSELMGETLPILSVAKPEQDPPGNAMDGGKP